MSNPWQDGVRAPGWRVLTALALVVVALHGWLLAAWQPAARPGWRAGAVPMQVRQIEPHAPSAAGAIALRSADGGADAEPTHPSVAAGAARAARASDDAAVVAAEAPRPRVAAAIDPASRLDLAPAAEPARRPTLARGPSAAEGAAPPSAEIARLTGTFPAAVDNAAAAGPDGEPTPLYTTELPASTALRYEMRRGIALGTALLEWQRSGPRYELSLLGSLQGAEVLGWTSRGGFDGAGLAPERFVVRRRGRELQAANFQRNGTAGGRITFSGPSVVQPLRTGVQDRLSWLVQLGAILQADPERGRAGSTISMWVVGTRGDAELWAFEAQPLAPLELPHGTVVGSVHFVRAAQRHYDARVEVWLDPAQGHRPLRLRYTMHPSGEVLDFRLIAEPTP